MQGNGPLNRKKKVTGTADESAMQTHGPGRNEGPVGDAGGYQDRKSQQSAARSGQNQPAARPQNPFQSAPGAGKPPFSGVNGGANRQNRPMNNSAAPFSSAGRPQQTPPQQNRPQQTPPMQNRPAQSQQRSASSGFGQASGGGQRSSGGGKTPLILIAVLAVLLLGGGGLSGLFGGGDSSGNASLPGASSSSSNSSSSLLGDLLSSMTDDTASSLPSSSSASSSQSSAGGGLLGGYSLSSLQDILGGSWYGGQMGYGGSSSSSSSASVSNGTLNRSVALGSRSKYTSIAGGGKDQFTVMVYMCGADLESKSAMGTKDLQEMLAATLGSRLKVIVYTGGSASWRNNQVSSKVNQIWQIDNGSMKCLNKDAGSASMTNPATLSAFIQYCAKNFPANRYALILWDHGSGSVSGYGYDEKNPRSGSMSLAGLNTAFQAGGVKFDFIGFDACLMATVENALMASKYADYLIASEETEPGIGWYYTDWLTALGKNTSMATLDIGKQICDDFISRCASSCRGQQTTLSLIDLAELSHTVPAKLTAFSKSVSSMISNREYQAVSNARSGCREFAVSSRIDQVDLADLCAKLNTAESAALANALKEAVKYNRINNISNANGLSIYFPYNKIANVDKAASTYAAIGMDESYAQAIRDFAGVEASGQAVSGGAGSAIPSLFGSSYGSSAGASGDMIGDLLSAFLGGGFGRVAGLDADNTGFLSSRALSDEALLSYLTSHRLDAERLAFRQDGGDWVLDLTPEEWALVTGVDQNVFYHNGAGYVDLGLDNLFEIDEAGRLKADMDGTWLAINGQVIPYYHETSQALENGGWIITGRTPALLNGARVDLLIVFDSEHEDGYVAGARNAYTTETETVAKAITDLQAGDEITFLADLYDDEQNYVNNYVFGNPVTVSGDLTVSSVNLPNLDNISVTYRITDIYQQAYWTPVIGK